MHKNPWEKELIFAAIFVILAVITGFIIQNWVIGWLICMVVYIIWKWVELYHFYTWLMNDDAKLKQPPLNTGIWAVLAKQVIKNKKLNHKIIKKNKFLLHQFETTAQALPYAAILLNKNFEIQWSNRESQKLFAITDKNLNTKIENIIPNPDFIEILYSKQDIHDIKIDNLADNSKITHIRLVKLSNKSYLLVARDISEQESLRKSRKAFVDNASHELRTPLTVITGYLEILANSADIADTWQKAISQAQAQATRMEKIIADMLKLSSMEHERYLERDDEDLNMPNLINDIFNDIKQSKHAQNYHLTANIDSELSIHGDQEEITRLIINLINNAIIHNAKNTNIELKWFKDNNHAHLWVCDSGKGIEKKHLTHLTERFYHVDNSRNKNPDSTGLGLAIIKQICQNHQAKLIIDTKVQTILDRHNYRHNETILETIEPYS
ncbi:MAG: phosphate regulon sensor protein PhoR [Proteobacteria bacterium]|nr:phosphate regulon sensor protein PhoR [Pseudomonadota bacterium]